MTEEINAPIWHVSVHFNQNVPLQVLSYCPVSGRNSFNHLKKKFNHKTFYETFNWEESISKGLVIWN